MKEVTIEEIRNIAQRVVSTTNESSNNYDAIDDVEGVLLEMFKKMSIAVEEIVKNNPDCKCTNCKCDK